MVSSAFLFGNTNSLFNTFGKMGIGVSFVDATSVDAVADAVTENTRLVFVETMPTREHKSPICGRLANFVQRGLVYVVDNTMTSPTCSSRNPSVPA